MTITDAIQTACTRSRSQRTAVTSSMSTGNLFRTVRQRAITKCIIWTRSISAGICVQGETGLMSWPFIFRKTRKSEITAFSARTRPVSILREQDWRVGRAVWTERSAFTERIRGFLRCRSSRRQSVRMCRTEKKGRTPGTR